MTKPKIVAVVGHTASGKTGLAIALAERLGGDTMEEVKERYARL
jgi:tRNA A37 N6-isopentenylltransferase MiaA